jgi:hypothetical protein
MTFRLGNTPVSALRLGNSTVSRLYRGTQLVFDAAPAPSFDADALAYITAVEAADTQALEAGVKTAINDFVVGCKADGIWAALKASCILAGARTLNGALVPLVGAAPTNFNFVTGDYNRKTGLVGNGSTKRLGTNRANNADPRDNNHFAVWVSQVATSGVFLGTVAITIAGTNEIGINNNDVLFFNRHSGSLAAANIGIFSNGRFSTGLLGASRALAESYIFRGGGNSVTKSVQSFAPTTGNVSIFAREDSALFTTARLSFYSIGESLNLAQLDARVSALMTAIDGAI